jgi:nucleoside-diphosphate-sugar epimerase
MLIHQNSSPVPPRRVVVIGAGGFVGGAVTRRLHRAGIETVPLARAEIDLLSPDAADSLTGYLRQGDSVVAVSARAPCRDLPTLIDNMKMVQAMATALSRVPVAHIVNISSDAVYADGPVPLSEDTPTAPIALHGVMHVAREIAFRALPIPLASVRPTLIYGAADPHNGYGPNLFRRLAAENQEIVLFGEGEEWRDHVLIDDVAELVYRVLAHRSTGTLNAVTGEVHSFRAVAEAVVAVAPHKVAIKTSPRQRPMPHNGYRPFDIAQCKAAFPDFAFTSLADGVARVQRETEAR